MARLIQAAVAPRELQPKTGYPFQKLGSTSLGDRGLRRKQGLILKVLMAAFGLILQLSASNRDYGIVSVRNWSSAAGSQKRVRDERGCSRESFDLDAAVK